MSKPDRPCACNCGVSTRGLFAPGHDARLVAELSNRVVAGLSIDGATADLRARGASDVLVDKLHESAERKLAAAARKTAVTETRRQHLAGPEYSGQTIAPKFDLVRIKVGRWSYAAQDLGDGDFEYTDGKGVNRRISQEKVTVLEKI